MGNLRSVYQAFHHVAPDANILLTQRPEEIAQAHRVVLPGQGAMPDCMREMDARGLRPVLLEAGEPLGVVSGIAGSIRTLLTVTGTPGHAGTVPMPLRRDAAAAAGCT